MSGEEPQYIEELSYVTNLKLRVFKNDLMKMGAKEDIIKFVDTIGIYGWLEQNDDAILKAFGYLPKDAKETMLRWTQTLPGIGKLTKTKLGQDRFISWRYLLDQPATRTTALFLAHLSFSFAFSGMPGVAKAV
jgi:hypothetical protein